MPHPSLRHMQTSLARCQKMRRMLTMVAKDNGAPLPSDVDGVRAYFAERQRGVGTGVLARGYAAADGERRSAFAEAALLSHLRDGDDAALRKVHLNTHEPFC